MATHLYQVLPVKGEGKGGQSIVILPGGSAVCSLQFSCTQSQLPLAAAQPGWCCESHGSTPTVRQQLQPMAGHPQGTSQLAVPCSSWGTTSIAGALVVAGGLETQTLCALGVWGNCRMGGKQAFPQLYDMSRGSPKKKKKGCFAYKLR